MKLVKEHIILEKFTDDDSDPIHDLGIGTKHLIEKWLEEYNITDYIINDDLTIDVNGQVNLFKKELEKLPDYIQFNIVYQHFDISRNKLISLKGCPYEIRESGMYYGNFWCFNNKLKNLKYFPKIITGNCNIENNLRKFTKQEVRKISSIGKDLEV